MKLREVAQLQRGALVHEQITEWLDRNGIGNYTIHPNGSVDVDGDVYLHKFTESALPVHFNNVFGDFVCYHSPLASLAGSPKYVRGDFSITGCPQLTSLVGSPRKIDGEATYIQSNIQTIEGAPESIGEALRLHATPVKSLHGIDKVVKHMKHFSCSDGATHILGLLLIDGLIQVEVGPLKVDEILTKYLGTGDIISAQDELIDAGFMEQAKL
jgi:hypothetical protein